MEVFAIRFIIRFPNECLTDSSPFYAACLDKKLLKPAMQASLMIIAGSALIQLERQHVTFRKNIFESLLGFTTSNSAHVRCIA